MLGRLNIFADSFSIQSTTFCTCNVESARKVVTSFSLQSSTATSSEAVVGLFPLELSAVCISKCEIITGTARRWMVDTEPDMVVVQEQFVMGSSPHKTLMQFLLQIHAIPESQ